MTDPTDDIEAADEVHTSEVLGKGAEASTRPAPPAMPYPGALDERLLTPQAPLPPGAGIRVFPPVIEPFPGTSAPPAWEPDPSGRHQWRWWNGTSWTGHVADDGVESEDPLPRNA